VAESLFPELDITLDRVYPDVPLGLRAEGVVIRLYDTVTVTLDHLRLSMPVFDALSLKNNVNVEASLLNGNVSGQITGVSTSPPACSGLSLILAGLKIQELNVALQGMRASLSFVLSGAYRVSQRLENPAGTGNLTLSGMTCAVQDDFLNTMGITTLDFDEATLTFERHQQRIDILELRADGEIMTVSAAGQAIQTGTPITDPASWRIDMKGSLYPKPAHVSRFSTILPMDSLFRTQPETGIPFTLTGPADALEIRG
jgi:type II secretion system protein N